MNTEHYMSKIERNTLCMDKAPEEIKQKVAQDLIWANQLAARLDLLDYEQRNAAITQLHQVLDDDYAAMGFEIEEKQSTGFHM